MEKAAINLGLITENLSVRTFILSGPLNRALGECRLPLVGPD